MQWYYLQFQSPLITLFKPFRLNEATTTVLLIRRYTNNLVFAEYIKNKYFIRAKLDSAIY